MSKQAEADLILKLYELRREETMRKARDWYFLNFNPASLDDVMNTMFSDKSGYLRMVISYWDMAAALVNQGAISVEMFAETNGEHISVFAKMEPFIEPIRAGYGQQFLRNLEKLIDASPNGRARVEQAKQNMKMVQERLKQQSAAASA